MKFLRRFFVSSTFRDFHAERDLLSTKIIGEFREEARKHGEEALTVDLRWGLDNFGLSEEDVVSKVLSVCLDEIRYSRPFMIVFLGDRFGWVPDRKLITDDFASKFDSVDGESITALEIKYGVENVENPRCIICIRDIPHEKIPEKFRDIYVEEDPICREKLRELKDRLRKNYSDRIIDYTADIDPDTGESKNFRTTKKNFGGNFISLYDAILSAIRADCADDWKKYDALPWQRRELEAANNFVTNRANLFVGRRLLLERIKEKLKLAHQLFLCGLPGSGKTSLACKLAADLRKKRRHVCFLQAGSSPQSSNAQYSLQQIIYFLREDVLHLSDKFSPPSDYVGWKNYLAALCEKIPRNVKVYIFVDAIEKMTADEHRNRLDFLPLSSENVYCLITCTDEFKIFRGLLHAGEFAKNFFRTYSDEEFYQSTVDFGEIFREVLAEDYFGTAFEKEMRKELDLSAEAFKSTEFRENYRYLATNLAKRNPDWMRTQSFANFRVQEIPELKIEERTTVLAAMLGRIGKELYDQTAMAVLKKKSSGNALYLEMTAQMLNMISTPELTRLKDAAEIIPLTVQLVDEMPDDPEKAANYIINLAQARLFLEGDKISEAIKLLAVSPHGLRLSDLQKILGREFNQLSWSLLQKFLHNFFTERQGGQIDLSHSIIRAGIRQKIDAENFKRLERQIADHVKTLPKEDFLRSQCAYYFAQKIGYFDFAAQLLAEAHAEKNPLLLFDIHESIIFNGGKLFVDFVENHFPARDMNDVLKFFTDDFQAMTNIGSASDFEIACDIFAKLAAKFNGLNYYRMKKFQADYEWRLDKIDAAKDICEEIIRWGEDNAELNDELNFCEIIFDACELLCQIAQNSDYDARYIFWAKKMAELSTTDSELYELLAKDKQLAEITDLETLRQNYARCKNFLEKDSPTDTKLFLTVSACTRLLHELTRKNLDDALALAEDGENYARLLLQTNGNNPDFVNAAVWFLLEMSSATMRAATRELGDVCRLEEMKANKFFQASAQLNFEAIKFSAVNYWGNPTKANMRLLVKIMLKLYCATFKATGALPFAGKTALRLRAVFQVML